MEHSERARYVTEQVALWIANDGDYNASAQYKSTVGVEVLSAYLTRVLQNASEYSAPWQVAQELSPNDYNRIDWKAVAEELTA